jgi:hypothetical protein
MRGVTATCAGAAAVCLSAERGEGDDGAGNVVAGAGIGTVCSLELTVPGVKDFDPAASEAVVVRVPSAGSTTLEVVCIILTIRDNYQTLRKQQQSAVKQVCSYNVQSIHTVMQNLPEQLPEA